MSKLEALRIFAISIFIGGLYSCSSHPTEAEIVAPTTRAATKSEVSQKPVMRVAPTSIEVQQVAAEQKAELVTELNFKHHQQNLTADNKAKLQKFVMNALKKGKIKEIEVITWADSEYPSASKKKLSQHERDIAKERNRAIQSFIESQNSDVKVKTYSMAERPNPLKQFVGSSEARIKKSFEAAGIPTTESSSKSGARASKAIIMAVIE